VRRYERENPGELIHLDIKKLGRIGLWDIALPADILARLSTLQSYRAKAARRALSRWERFMER
jgi:hypothetical protein